MSDTDKCVCGHVEDEHEENAAGHPAECGVKGCDCCHFECDEDADDECPLDESLSEQSERLALELRAYRDPTPVELQPASHAHCWHWNAEGDLAACCVAGCLCAMSADGLITERAVLRSSSSGAAAPDDAQILEAGVPYMTFDALTDVAALKIAGEAMLRASDWTEGAMLPLSILKGLVADRIALTALRLRLSAAEHERDQARQWAEAAEQSRAVAVARLADVEQERDATAVDVAWLESTLGLHTGAEMTYVVDGYEVLLTEHDGATTYHLAQRPTLAEAIRAARLEDPRARSSSPEKP